MPDLSSETFTSTTRFRSSSPPNSRSNSASPPLPWPSSASSLSSSPAQHSFTGIFKRSISNLSNSSIFYGQPSISEESIPGSSFVLPESMKSTDCYRNQCSPRIVTSFAKKNDNTGQEDVNKRSLSTSVNQNLTNSSGGTKVTFVKKENGGFCGRAVGGEGDFGGIGNSDSRGQIGTAILLPIRIFVWYINLILRITRRTYNAFSYVIWAPIIWISAWICVFWVIIQMPLNFVKWFILVLYTPAFERTRSKRCVLISGGSTLQAIHLARNFYKAGARVVVCEIEGLFGLARFSTACSKFYNVPRPSPGTAAEYVNALKKIVERERAVYYIPVSSTNDAYYDALAKPHLEIMGCECFVPGAAEVTSLEDPLQLLQRCSSVGLPTPVYFVINSPEDLTRLYATGSLNGTERHVMVAAGPAGMKERTKIIVPSSTADGPTPQDIRRKLERYDINEKKPWIVIREPGGPSRRGHHLVTCTTVKDSRVVANVTCRIDENRGLIPEERNDVEQWLETYFQRPFSNKFKGHLSFKLAYTGNDEIGLVPIGCRVGVPLPYLCLTSVHPRLVWRPCRHFSRHNSANLLVNDKYKQTSSNVSAARSIDLRSSNSLTVTVLDKRDVLFVYWDPLPYCVYYHLQFPFRRIAGVIRERRVQHRPPLAVVQ